MAVFDNDLVGDEFKESEHPRAKNGQFTNAGGSGSENKEESRGDLGSGSPRHIYGQKKDGSIPVALKITNYPNWNKVEVVKEFDKEDDALNYAEERGEAVKSDYQNKTKNAEKYGIANWVTPKELEYIKEHSRFPDNESEEESSKEKASNLDFTKEDVIEFAKKLPKEGISKKDAEKLSDKELAMFVAAETRVNADRSWADSIENAQLQMEHGREEVIKRFFSKDPEGSLEEMVAKSIVRDSELSDKKQEKVGVVMKEFKEGELKSGSGEKVTDPKQAMAIALSEADKIAKDKEIPEKQDEPEKAGDEVALNKGEKKMADEVKKAPAEEKVEEVKEEKVTEDACGKAEDKEVKPACDEKEDKRKLIDEIGGILKDKLSEEEWRTVIKKAEELAYNDSEASADDEDKKDLKGKEKKAFAEGVVYGEEKEKAEPKKLDSEHESEGMKKAEEKKEEKAEDKKMAKDEALVMDADTIKAEAKAEVIADFKARETARRAVRKMVGDVDVFAFDSAEEIYKFACEKAGMDLNEIVSFKDAFKGLSLNKSKLAMDASPVSGSDVECFKDIRLT